MAGGSGSVPLSDRKNTWLFGGKRIIMVLIQSAQLKIGIDRFRQRQSRCLNPCADYEVHRKAVLRPVRRLYQNVSPPGVRFQGGNSRKEAG